MMKGLGASERMFEILDRCPSISSEGGKTPKLKGDIKFNDISFRYPTHPSTQPPVLRDLSFHIPQKKFVAIVGLLNHISIDRDN